MRRKQLLKRIKTERKKLVPDICIKSDVAAYDEIMCERERKSLLSDIVAKGEFIFISAGMGSILFLHTSFAELR